MVGMELLPPVFLLILSITILSYFIHSHNRHLYSPALLLCRCPKGCSTLRSTALSTQAYITISGKETPIVSSRNREYGASASKIPPAIPHSDYQITILSFHSNTIMRNVFFSNTPTPRSNIADITK